MTLLFKNITPHLVQSWARLYTMGLPGEVKAMRRGEIASDVWEQTEDVNQSLHGRHGVTWQILARMVFGMPNDLLWRAEQSRVKNRGDLMNLTLYLIRPRTYINLAVVLVSMFILFPIGVGAFVAAVVASVVPPVMLSSIFTYKLTNISFGYWTVDTLPEAIVVSLIGLVLVLLEIFVANIIVSLLRRFVSVRIGNIRFGETA